MKKILIISVMVIIFLITTIPNITAKENITSVGVEVTNSQIDINYKEDSEIDKDIESNNLEKENNCYIKNTINNEYQVNNYKELTTTINKIKKEEKGNYTILLSGGTYTFNQRLSWDSLENSTLNIKPNTNSKVIFDGEKNTSLFAIRVNNTLKVENISFINGFSSSSAGTIHNAGTLEVINCSFINNYANIGGVIYSTANSNVIIKNSIFNNNQADTYGGVLYTSGNTNIINSIFQSNQALNKNGGVITNLNYLSITNSNFNNNTANKGGAIYHTGTYLSINKSNFKNNQGKIDSGAISNTNIKTNTSIVNSLFANNYAKQGSGGAISNIGLLNIISCTFNNNSIRTDIKTYGGAIVSNNQSLYISNSTFNNNYAWSGGGVSSNSPITITDTIFNNNYVNESAGALGCNNISYMENVTFTNNKANISGGAIVTNPKCIGNIINCSFINNKALVNGGAIDNYYGYLQITKCLFDKNIAIKDGGAIATLNYLNSNQCTFKNNQAKSGAVIISVDILIIRNSEFYSNTAIVSGTIFHSLGIANITYNIFKNNIANHGGAFEGIKGTATITNNKFINNKAITNGSALAYQNGKLINKNNQFIKNTGNGVETIYLNDVSYIKSNNIYVNTSILTKIDIESYYAQPGDTIHFIATVQLKNPSWYDDNLIIDTGITQFIISNITTLKADVISGESNYLYNVPTSMSNKDIYLTTTYLESNGFKSSNRLSMIHIRNSTYKTSPLLTSNNYNCFINEKINIIGTLQNLATGSVKIYLNNKLLTTQQIINGKIQYTYLVTNTNLVGVNYIKFIYPENTKYRTETHESIFTVKKLNTIVTMDNIKTYPNNNITFKAIIKDTNGNLLNGGKVAFKINGMTQGLSYVKNGIAIYNFNIPDNWSSKDYKITAVYSGTPEYCSNRIENSILSIQKQNPKINIDYTNQNNSLIVKLKITGSINNIIASYGKSIIKINQKTVTPILKINNGIAQYTINLDKGKYNMTVTFSGNNQLHSNKIDLPIIKT
ncbi:MAG: hypothetical protein Q4Q23_03080 [Methanobacteriaceae archaeon]|nr:hypothetical protein [Methanobacteriaceae archaeon]